MRANYHTHTWRCNHASDTEEEYIQAALDNGMEVLGFSDHSPYFFPGEYYSHFRMRPELLDGYVNTVLGLKEQYKGQIEIHLGLELEYYPDLLPKLLPVLQDKGIEYVILGQHLQGNEIGPNGREHYNGNPTDDRKLLENYVNQTIEGMYTGLFTYLAHPDLFWFLGEEAEYRRQMRRLCKAAKACQMPLEINLWGAYCDRYYPVDAFWQEAAEENCRTVLGRDAHNVQCFSDEKSLKRGMELVERYGLELLDTVPLRSIK